MPKIVKYEIETDVPEDDTFETTRIVIEKKITRVTTVTDSEGNIVSNRRAPIETSETTIDEGISAIGAISKTPATVVIMETDAGLTEEGVQRNAARNARPANRKL